MASSVGRYPCSKFIGMTTVFCRMCKQLKMLRQVCRHGNPCIDYSLDMSTLLCKMITMTGWAVDPFAPVWAESCLNMTLGPLGRPHLEAPLVSYSPGCWSNPCFPGSFSSVGFCKAYGVSKVMIISGSSICITNIDILKLYSFESLWETASRMAFLLPPSLILGLLEAIMCSLHPCHFQMHFLDSPVTLNSSLKILQGCTLA